MAKKVYLAFLWHQHQPFYKDLKSGNAVMPWVRLHATKDYYDMAAILENFPKIQCTFNLVPSLIVQLLDFAENRATDPWLERTLLPASELSEKEQIWLLENFFFCNWETMIFPNARYSELFEKRGKFATRKDLERMRTYFKVQDFLDLQVWFNLAWIDPLLLEKDPWLSGLYKKGKNFSEEEKKLLIEKQREIAKLVIQKHKELWDKNQIEISTTPFYHPILPLLCDTDIAQMAMPGSAKPKNRFRHPEDAKEQVEKALEFMEKIFGRRPPGMWPSEGSVSEEVIQILSGAKIQWAATDEGILFHSLEREGLLRDREELYQPYWVEAPNGGGKIQMVFRDHSLSDAIGFVYARMDAKSAVEDFVHRILQIADAIPDSDAPPLISLILDGENCWEYYRRDGYDFLKILYATLSDHPRIETTTIGNYLARFPAKKSLKKLWAGSWIGSNLAIWIGHPEDNQAWDILKQTRDFLMEKTKQKKKSDSEIARAWESLYIAEGSDWCWWYGEQNSTAQDEIFDELFRTHLANVYRFLGEEPPQNLNIAIKTKEWKAYHNPPIAFITPTLDGLISSYYEWRAAGSVQNKQAGGTMQQAEIFLSTIFYGFNLENFYLRLDPNVKLDETDLSEIRIQLHFLKPEGKELEIAWQEGKALGFWQEAGTEEQRIQEIACNKIIEIALPFSLLQVKENEPIEFVILVSKGELQMERWPANSSILFSRPTAAFGSDIWSV